MMTGIEEKSELMTIREVVFYLHVTRQTVWRWVNIGILLKKKGLPDGQVRFDRKAVEGLAEGKSTGEVAGYLKVTCCTIRYWAAIGILPAKRRTANGHRRFDMETVKTFVANREALMTTGEVARRCGVCANTIIRWADNRELPVTERTPGGHRRFKKEVVLAFANTCKGNKSPRS